MEEKEVSTSKFAFGISIWLAAAVIVYSLLLFLLDLSANSFLPYLSYIIFVAALFIASKTYRDKHSNGFITYGKSVNVGFLTGLFASIIIGIYTYFYFAYIDPGAYLEQLALMEEKYIQSGMSDNQIDQALALAERFQKPWISAFFAIIGNAVIGLFLALIVSIFVKRNPPEGEATI